jgi:hypothetical protein
LDFLTLKALAPKKQSANYFQLREAFPKKSGLIPDANYSRGGNVTSDARTEYREKVSLPIGLTHPFEILSSATGKMVRVETKGE